MTTLIVLSIVGLLVAVIYLAIQVHLLRCRIEWIEQIPHPEFEYDKKDGCWTIVDSLRIDNVVWFDKPTFKAFINYQKKNKEL